ncbi:TonB-dependent receptor [Woeseia oceani]|uniref:Secretin/TonB short N-terminal domain-containing protein n=1 Tax=Woeseia oceani TaxID=1548547 RepID=A0A193LC76_9GAMM|nr:TonB-dependent receptor [Woeseia oceani]ANO50112.1 hypothetical protein BA177_01760 [Woeseia oceani]
MWIYPAVIAAQDATYNFSMDAQELSKSLREYARITRAEVTFREEVVAGKTAPVLRGVYTASDALNMLIEGSGLVVDRGRSGVLILRRAPEQVPETTAQAQPIRQNAASDSFDLEGDYDERAPEEIVVSGSRITRSGFVTPTPTTMLSAEEMRQFGESNVADVLNTLPAFAATSTPQTATRNINLAGGNFLNLRNLGVIRTLVLVDGRRFVPTSYKGYTSINVVPFEVVKRTEVVTGGASAAWGSGAVAGVVNIILNDDLQGFRGGIQAGISEYSDAESYRGSFGWGSDYQGGRGHLLIGAEFNTSKGITTQSDRPWTHWQMALNPNATSTNGQYRYFFTEDVRHSNMTPGGLITTTALAGTQFLPGGVSAPFNYGDFRTSSYMVGGDGMMVKPDLLLRNPLDRANFFAHSTYELNENVELTAELSYAVTATEFDFWPHTDSGLLLIRRDNAFLPGDIADRMDAEGISFFRMGRANLDMGFLHDKIENETIRAVVGADFDLANSWKLSTYYQHGRNTNDVELTNARIRDNYTASVDSVIGPNGTPVCRSSIADPGNGCVPINLFGEGSPSLAALDYVHGSAWRNHLTKQDVIAATVQGEPISNWAGPVSVAFGAEYRRDSLVTTVDEISAASGWTTGSFLPFSGKVNVREAFVETVVPLLVDKPFARSLDLNASARYFDYSTNSGSLHSWKIGTTWDITDEFRLRATLSDDMRAPTMEELFTEALYYTANISDPVLNEVYRITDKRSGNPDLEPETARTVTAGIVYTPQWTDRLRMSLDYHRIGVDGYVTTETVQRILNRCMDGNARLCDLITRDSDGRIDTINRVNVNLAERISEGYDLETVYKAPLAVGSLDGNLTVRAIVSYQSRLSYDDGITSYDAAGVVGTGNASSPHWRGRVTATYAVNGYQTSMAARHVGDGAYSKTYPDWYLEDRHISSRTYFDFSLNKLISLDRSDTKVRLSLSIRNLFGAEPPLNPSTGYTPNNPALYDYYGRYYRVGARVSF